MNNKLSHSQGNNTMFLNTITTSTQVTMNSQEVSDLVQSRHDSVKRAIERLAERRVIKLPPMVEIKTATRPAMVYVFSGEKGKRDSLIVVAQLSPEFTGAIVDRWIELEKQVATPKVPQSFAEALQLAADQAKQLELAKPKIEHYDRVVERSTLLNATQVGSKIGMSAQKLNKHLSSVGVYDQRIKRSKVFSSWFVTDGLGEMKQTDSGYPQALFTTKGEAWVIENFSSEVA